MMWFKKLSFSVALAAGFCGAVALLAGMKPVLAQALTPACGSYQGAAKIICYDPIHRNGGSKVTVSSYLPGFEGSKLIDANLDTKWNSGGYAPAWFQIDMRGVHNLNQICLVPGMKPAAGMVAMDFTVMSKSTPPGNVWPHRINDYLQNGVTYCIHPLQRVAGRYITITTLSSPFMGGVAGGSCNRLVRVRCILLSGTPLKLSSFQTSGGGRVDGAALGAASSDADNSAGRGSGLPERLVEP